MKIRRNIRKPQTIAVTPGEPGGIGPEITAHLFAGFTPARSTAWIIGAWSVLEPWFERYGVAPVVIRARVNRPDVGDLLSTALEMRSHPAREAEGPRVFVLDTAPRERYARGRDSRGGGRHSGFALEVACRLASEGLVEGIVTGPISKNSLQLGGYPFSGHTELLSRHFRAPHCQMMMVYRMLRVVPLTRHIPLTDVSGALSTEKILAALRVVSDSLVWEFGVPQPHLAVSGLNPHAGEGGVLGSEEIEIIAPAIRRARRLGIRVTGPVPGDALFQEAESGTFDAFIAMYHDQGLIPFKMISKRRGVNVTVGLPVVRTSEDHGVAYDIAGKGRASTESLKEAYLLAETLVRRRRKRTG
jgi:4-hydroxythreonine-4-phosphate dehydrogenase